MYYINNMTDIIAECVEELKINNPSLKEGSIKAYKGQLKSIMAINEDIKKYDDFFKSPKEIIKSIQDSGKSMNTKKAYLGLLCSLTRGKALSDDKEMVKSYSLYVAEFDDLKREIEVESIKQKPTGQEAILKGLTMNGLKRTLYKHKKDYMDSCKTPGANDLEALRMYIVGLFHIHFTLRNEVPTLNFTDKHLDNDEWKKNNYIICYSRNKKEMVINKNKVRDPSNPLHKARKEKIPTDLNWALNKWIQHNEPNTKLYDGENSGYTKLIKRIWKHKKLELTSSLIRKLYATEVRMEHKGKMSEELKACEKLDHSLEVHNKEYILYFD